MNRPSSETHPYHVAWTVFFDTPEKLQKFRDAVRVVIDAELPLDREWPIIESAREALGGVLATDLEDYEE